MFVFSNWLGKSVICLQVVLFRSLLQSWGRKQFNSHGDLYSHSKFNIGLFNLRQLYEV